MIRAESACTLEGSSAAASATIRRILLDPAPGLQALKVSESVNRTVQRVNDARWSHTIGENKANIAGTRTNFEHSVAGLKAKRLEPIGGELGPQRLPLIDLVPAKMAEVLLEWLLHGGSSHRPKRRTDHPARPSVKRMESAPMRRVAVGRLGLEI